MDVQDYLVTLGVRPAELSGLKELPGGTKDRLTPLLLLAPWLATTPLSRALDKFEEAYPSRPYFIDVDTYYEVNDRPNDAKALWQRLAQRPADVEAWWELLAEYPNANPCLLMAQQPIDRAREQIAWARENSRTFCVRMNLAKVRRGSGIPEWMPMLVSELAAEGANDYAIMFEFGWVENPLLVAAEASGCTNSFFSAIPAEVPVVVSCTSFPTDFTSFDGIDVLGFTNRDLVAQVQQTTNLRVVYGDWGTTRPRRYGHASPPRNRIDYPTDISWVFARNQDNSVDFQEAAQRIVGSPHWSGRLGVWGEQCIEGTAAGQAFAIDSMRKMYAARINIHLHRQAFYGQLPPPEALDEEWSDDI